MKFLIRHAESAANAGLKTSDPASIPLTRDGVSQAEELAVKFPYEPDLIIFTPYVRTKFTALPLINRFPDADIEIWPMHEFTFLSPELCRDTTSVERLPMVKEYWDACDPDFVHGDGAESFNQFANRVTDCVTVLKSLNKRVALFTHEQVMRYVKMSRDGFVDMKSFNESYKRVSFRNVELLEIKA